MPNNPRGGRVLVSATPSEGELSLLSRRTTAQFIVSVTRNTNNKKEVTA